MKGDKPKWIFSFFLLMATFAWFVLCVLLVKSIVANPTPTGVLETAGATGFSGALLTWDALIVQYWFRKAPPTNGNGT